jgi:hypothetical protein
MAIGGLECNVSASKSSQIAKRIPHGQRQSAASWPVGAVVRPRYGQPQQMPIDSEPEESAEFHELNPQDRNMGGLSSSPPSTLRDSSLRALGDSAFRFLHSRGFAYRERPMTAVSLCPIKNHFLYRGLKMLLFHLRESPSMRLNHPSCSRPDHISSKAFLTPGRGLSLFAYYEPINP